MAAARKPRLSDPHAELPIKNHKYVKNCTELYMANKRIDKIANFESFVNLEVLWINGNNIQHLDGLDACFRLKQLFAQNNSIRSLDGSSLVHFKFLQELRLYDNKLKDLHGTLHVLSRLSHLRDLDLFGNTIAEEEHYRLQVIRAIPSLDVLDRHVVTDQERENAARLQLHANEDGDTNHAHSNHQNKRSKKPTTVAGAPPQALSGTVKMLFKEVKSIKRQQEKEAIESAEREHRELSQAQHLFSSSYQRTVSNNKRDDIPGLGDWEVASLKKHFLSLGDSPQSGVAKETIGLLFQYLHTRGFAIRCDGEGNLRDDSLLDRFQPVDGTLKWKEFVQCFVSQQLRCELMAPEELRQQASVCFDRCAAIQRRLQLLSTNDAKSTQLAKDSLELSQQGYHLQSLADGDSSASRSRSSRLPSSADVKYALEPISSSTPRTRFYMTAFSRERVSSPPDCSAKFHELQADKERISDTLAGKYKIRQKDFTKYLLKNSSHTTKLVRQNYQL